jgi:hypothetical protein
LLVHGNRPRRFKVEEIGYIDPEYVSEDRPPTRAQWWALAQVALKTLGENPPETRREATELINKLHTTISIGRLPALRTLWSQPN